jgi:IclR family acetate operon transcriptional repressor
VSARRDSVQSVERAFDLIEALAGGDELGVTELAERTGLVPSTAHRLLATLANRGYATRSSTSGGYVLGYKVVELASALENSLARLRDLARPHLESIQQATGESANLTILDGDTVVYVDSVQGSRSMRMFTAVGAAVLAHTTASGKAMLAYRDRDSLTQLYAEDELSRLTPRTLTTVKALRKDLERTARRGYAIDNEEHEEGVSCVAVPIFDQTDRPCAAMSISAPTARIVHDDTGELVELLREHAAEISTALGHTAGEGAGGDGGRPGGSSGKSG